MNRRTFLGVVAAGTVTLAGCVDGGTEPSDDDGAGASGGGSPAPASETPTPGPRYTAVETVTGTAFVREAVAVPELVAPDSPDSFGVYGDRDEQYVVALLDARDETGPPVDEVELSADGESFDFTTDVGYGNWALFDYGEAYLPDDDPNGWVVARLPDPLDADSATITWPGGEHSLDEAVLTDLARPPADFDVRSFELPEQVDPTETITATATVENTADVDGTFVAAVNRSGPLVAHTPETSVRLPVAGGETATWEYEFTVDGPDFEGDRPMRLRLAWRDGSTNREATVRGQSGTQDGTETHGETRTQTGDRTPIRTTPRTETVTRTTPRTESRPGTPTPLDE